MKKYLGVKIVQAEPMTNVQHFYSKYGVGEKPTNPNIEIMDGYSFTDIFGRNEWLPRNEFEKAYKSTESLVDDIVIHVNTNSGDWVIPHSMTFVDEMDKFRNFSSDQELKKFCIEQAARNENSSGSNVVIIAKNIYDWIKNGIVIKPESLDFGQAIEALKQGKKVARKGWNGKWAWISLTYTERLAESVSDTYITVPVIEIKTIDRKLSVWFPSLIDILAEDWEIVD